MLHADRTYTPAHLNQTLRRKIESELSRKRPGPPASSLSQSNLPTNQNSSYPNPAQRSRRQAQKGTVAGLKPSPALTVPENMTVSDASQLCAAKRTDCVLVVDQEEGLSGIFTAKDLAFRVSFPSLPPFIYTFCCFQILWLTSTTRILGYCCYHEWTLQVTAEGLDPRTTLVSQIMTPNPMVTRDTTSATQALQLMVEKHFRHLVSFAITNVKTKA
jgi:CBS domain-containing protein